MKWNKINKIIIVAVIFIFAMTPLSPAMTNINLLSENLNIENYMFEYTASFSKEDLLFERLMGYDKVEMQDGILFGDVGKPMLPLKEINIALPEGMKVKELIVTETQIEEVAGNFNIYPAQPPRRSDSSGILEFFEPDEDIYQSNIVYPSKTIEFVRQSDLAGQSIATILICPLMYTPVEEKLELYTSISFIIKGESGYICGDYLPAVSSKNMIDTYNNLIKGMVANDGEVKLNADSNNIYKTASLPPGGPYEHVIITSDAYASYWDPLVEWHTKRGLQDTVVTTEWIYSNYPTGDNQFKIRSFVIDSHTTWGTMYYLIAGEDQTVPFEHRTYDGIDSPSDHYYSDYDDDWTHEVFVGRVTAEGETQINRYINKVLTYEKNPPVDSPDYHLNITLVGMDMDAETHKEDLKENIASYIPGRFDITKIYDSDYSDATKARDDFILALNNGSNLVNHADHCNEECLGFNWQCFYRGHANTLTNGNKYFILFSVGCHANAMDYNDGDCISEYCVIYNDDGAGIAFVGNTRYGMYISGTNTQLTDKLDIEFWKAIFDRDIFVLGDAFIDAKHHFSTAWPNDQPKKHCEWTLNLLGEPSLPIWTETPMTFDVTHQTEIQAQTTSFNVHVEETGGGAIEDAYVCLWKDGEVYETDYTDSSGDADLTISPLSSGIMYVTVTMHNYVPSESEVTITQEPGAPYVPSDPDPYDDETGVLIDKELSWTGGDPDPGDTVTYDVYFGTTNPPPLVSSGQSQTTYNPPGDLSYETLYYWKIVSEDDDMHTTNGPIWSFTTIAENHMIVEDKTVSPGADGVIINVNGQWTDSIGAYTMVLNYDPDIVEFDYIDFTGTVGELASYKPQDEPEGPGNISAGAIWIPATAGPGPGSGLLFKVVINISETAPLGDTDLLLIEAWPDPISGPSKTKYTDQGGFGIVPDRVDGKLTISEQSSDCGDANGDGGVDIDDVVYLIAYIFSGGPPPTPMVCIGDANGDGGVDIDDVVYLIAYIFSGGPAPVSDCCG